MPRTKARKVCDNTIATASAKIIQTCLDGVCKSWHMRRMRNWMHLVLVFFMLGAFLAQTTFALAAPLTTEVTDVTALSAPCCHDDCPTTPDCESACVAVMQCQAVIPFLILQEIPGADILARGVAAFTFSTTQTPKTAPQHGLRRPPKV